MNIGLLMINGEDDVLADTLAANSRFFDCFYVLDGTMPNMVSRAICEGHPKCAGYLTDGELDPTRFPSTPVDGYRQALYERAAADHGYDHWFLLLHGDEVWTGLPDLDDVHDGYIFRLPIFFPRDGEPWSDDRPPLEQLRWSLAPGYPEFRMFKGATDVAYSETQHFNVVPSGINRLGSCDKPILHYLYRSPEVQRERARRHLASGFDPANYAHITERDEVYWTDEMIGRYQAQSYFTDLVYAE